MSRALVVLTLVLLVAGCSAPTVVGSRTATAPAPSAATAPSSTDPYVDLARRLDARDVEVWFEADLVRSWREGPVAFDDAINRLSDLARVPGVVGFKVADELGYGDGLATRKQVHRFLRDADAALQEAAPGKELLVDMVVPDLGCLPWQGAPQRSCAAEVADEYPASTMAAVTGYLRTGRVDRLDLSTGLLEPQAYATWGLTSQEAQRRAWRHVRALGWAAHTTLQSRKALAAEGGYQGTTEEAEADVATYVEAPVAGGAGAVDIWTWRQPYDGATVSLLDERLRPNPLWLLLGEQPASVRLITHMTPSAMPTDMAALQAEVDLAASVFDAVFVAAGTG